MGETRVDVTIRNPADMDRSWAGEFLVDTGATNSIVPRRHLESIGLQPIGHRTYGMADGSDYRAEIGGAVFEFLGERSASTVVFGPDEAEPLLGLTALESTGFKVDPVNECLQRAKLRL
ncbi:MAG: clan AA aspartic protease [bacterium]|nr:clan AA aspartic protease [bacterium]MDE0669937.1 clan AA aspartic protease [bacterium]